MAISSAKGSCPEDFGGWKEFSEQIPLATKTCWRRLLKRYRFWTGGQINHNLLASMMDSVKRPSTYIEESHKRYFGTLNGGWGQTTGMALGKCKQVYG